MNTISKESGVDLDAGNVMSAHAARVSRLTQQAARGVKTYDFSGGHFRGPIAFDFHLPPGSKLFGGADGIGTKVGPIRKAGEAATAGYNLVAMCSGDITRRGGRPLCLWNVLDTSSLGDPASSAFLFFRHLIEGLAEACRIEDIALMGGETAELGVFVGSEDPNEEVKFNWAGFALGALHPDALITGRKMRPGDVIYALPDGFRSNGISAARKALKFAFGERYWENPEAEWLIKAVAAPAALYDRFFVEANGWNSDFKNRIPLTGLVHITGGGIPEKFGDILFPTGYSADLYNLYDPSRAMKWCAARLREERERNKGEPITDENLYGMWTGGQGALAIVPAEHALAFEMLAHERNRPIRDCGRITMTKGRPSITITSKFGGGTFPVYPKQ